MKSKRLEKFRQEMQSLIGARYPLISIVSFEERRVLQELTDLFQDSSWNLLNWSRTQGVRKGEEVVQNISDPAKILDWFSEQPESSILILRDYHPYLKDSWVIRRLRDLATEFKFKKKNLILCGPIEKTPEELSKEMALVDFPLAERDDVIGLVQQASQAIPKAPSEEEMETLVNSTLGLTFDEIENALAKSIVSHSNLDPLVVLEEKKQAVRRSGILEFVDVHQTSIPEVGGLENLKNWLRLRKRGFSEDARQIGLPIPKGILLVGIPGCGKSLTAKTVSREWNFPLLRLDLGRIFSGLVGSSEANIRSALKTAEAIAPCVLWMDEIEKGLSGSRSGSSDSGTSSRVFGTVLTWMQEKTSPVFVVATANDISSLPPELLRKGRFDEIFYIDLPSEQERKAILKSQLKRYGWTLPETDLPKVVQHTPGFSGAEIEEILVSARYSAFSENKDLTVSDLVSACESVVPLSKTMNDQINQTRSWARGRARPASGTASHKGERTHDHSSSLLSRTAN